MNKRLMVRLAVVSTVVVSGAIAIAQAQRGETAPQLDADALAAAAVMPEGTPQPITVASEHGDAPAGDPFAGARRATAAAPQEPSRWNGPDSARPINDYQEERQYEAAPAIEDDAASDSPAAHQSQAARPSADPFGMRRGNSGEVTTAVNVSGPSEDYAAEPVSAEVVESQPEPAEEPQPQDASAPAPFAGFPRGGEPRPAAIEPEDPQAYEAAESAAAMPVQAQQTPSAFPAQLPAARPLQAFPASASSNHLSQSGPAELPVAAATEGTGRPGGKELEGPQSPQLSIEKLAPAEIQVGKTATFQIIVRNVGTVAAGGVEIHDEVPAGTQLVSTSPQAQQAGGALVWSLGELQPGAETTVQMDVNPLEEGEIGSVASVMFRAEASVRTVATRPDLKLEVTAPKKVMIGDQVQLAIKISNPGTGVAQSVVLTEHVPQGLSHSAGAELEFEVGQLKPGESRQLDLTLTAAQAGQVVNRLTARGDANLLAEEQVALEVIAPGLQVAMDGPPRRYLERQATYTVSVTNTGTAPAKDVELVTHLPKGMKFIEANNAGHYDASQHSVSWSLEQLPPSVTGTVTVTTMPIEAGEQKLRIQGKAQQGLTDEDEKTVMVEGLAALSFEVADVEPTIEVGGETTYEIRVVNQGSKACTNVQVAAILPPEMQPVSADGPVRHSITGQQVLFEQLPRLAPKADTTYQVRVKGLQPGHHRISVQVITSELREPVTKEESTHVYSDE